MRPSAVVLFALATGACSVGPTFERPAAPSTTAYRGPLDTVRDAAGSPRPNYAAPVTIQWWRAFGSPEIDMLVDQAMANNPSLAASNATLARARELIVAAAGRRLPQVDANARVELQQVNLGSFGLDGGAVPGFSIGNPTFDLYTIGGGVSYDMDLFGRNRRRLEKAVAEAEANQRAAEAAHLTIAGRVVEQVLAIAAARARLVAAESLIRDDQRLIDLSEARRRAGEGTLTEVIKVQAQLANDQYNLPSMRRAIDQGRHMLATLVGITPDAIGATDFDLDRLTVPRDIPVAMPSELVRKRPDILQAEADLHAATAEIGIATASLYPNLTIGGTLGYSGQKPSNLFSEDFRAFDIFAGLTAPIFRGGTLKAEQRAAVKGAEASAATYRQTVLDAFAQVADLLGSLNNDQRILDNVKNAVVIAERSRNLSKRSFQVGNSGILNVIDAERLYQQARLQLVEAKVNQFSNIARLYVATAGGWTGPANAAELTASSVPAKASMP